jgi:hypothetical protein
MTVRATFHAWKHEYEQDAVAIYEKSGERDARQLVVFIAVLLLIFSAICAAFHSMFAPGASIGFLLAGLLFISTSLVWRRNLIIFSPTQVVFRSALKTQVIPFTSIVGIRKTKVRVPMLQYSVMAPAVELRLSVIGTAVYLLQVNERDQVLQRLTEATGKPIDGTSEW